MAYMADYMALIQEAKTDEERQGYIEMRQQKEEGLKAENNWEEKWIPTSELAYPEVLQNVVNGTAALGTGNTQLSDDSWHPREFAPINTGGGVTNSINVNTNPYNELAWLEEKQAELERTNQLALAAAQQQGIAALEGQRTPLTQNRNEAARQQDVIRQQQLRVLPYQLLGQGITGGMAESSVNQIGAAYGNAVGGINQNYNNALFEIDRAVADVEAQSTIEGANQAADLARSMIPAYQTALQNARDQQNWEAEAAWNQAAYTAKTLSDEKEREAEKRAETMNILLDLLDRGLLTEDMAKELGTTREALEAYVKGLRQGGR